MDYLTNRQTKIGLLKDTRKYVVAFGSPICASLSVAVDMRSFGSARSKAIEAAWEISKYISDALRPHTYYSTWCQAKHPDFCKAIVNDGMYTPGRLAWIDWMIACYEEDIANYKEP